MRIRKLGLIAVFLAMTASYALADTPMPNVPHKAYSANGLFYAEMVPDGGEGGYGEGEGTVYRMRPDGPPIKLWSVPFFSSEVYLSNDGRHLIAFGPWAMSFHDLAIAFCAEGKILQEYTVNDLVRDQSKLEYTVSHFRWRAYFGKAAFGFSPDQKKFTVTLMDKTIYEFDVATGNVVNEITAEDQKERQSSSDEPDSAEIESGIGF